MTKLSPRGNPTTQNIEDLLLDRLIYGEFASSYDKPYFNLWFLGDNEKILPFHAYAAWDEPFLKKLHSTIIVQSKYRLQYIPMVEGVVFQHRGIREVGKDNDELYFATNDIYLCPGRRKVYRVKNENPYVTPYHVYANDDEDYESIRGLTREHILRIAFYGVAL